MKIVPLLFPLSLAVFATLVGTALFPGCHLFTFSPLFALIYMQRSLISSLWISALCGTFLDLLSSELPLGFSSLVCVLTTALLYRYRRHFFEDKPLPLSLLTALISATTTLVQIGARALFDQPLHALSGKFILTDLCILPMCDGLYAFLWFYLPMQGYLFLHKTGFRALWLRLQSLRQLPASDEGDAG